MAVPAKKYKFPFVVNVNRSCSTDVPGNVPMTIIVAVNEPTKNNQPFFVAVHLMMKPQNQPLCQEGKKKRKL